MPKWFVVLAVLSSASVSLLIVQTFSDSGSDRPNRLSTTSSDSLDPIEVPQATAHEREEAFSKLRAGLTDQGREADTDRQPLRPAEEADRPPAEAVPQRQDEQASRDQASEPTPITQVDARDSVRPEPVPGLSRDSDEPNRVLLEKAQALIALGDIAGARSWLTLASDRGSEDALYRLAQTYDPDRLTEWRVIGVPSDIGRARALYTKAAAAGLKTASDRLAALGK